MGAGEQNAPPADSPWDPLRVLVRLYRHLSARGWRLAHTDEDAPESVFATFRRGSQVAQMRWNGKRFELEKVAD